MHQFDLFYTKKNPLQTGPKTVYLPFESTETLPEPIQPYHNNIAPASVSYAGFDELTARSDGAYAYPDVSAIDDLAEPLDAPPHSAVSSE